MQYSLMGSALAPGEDPDTVNNTTLWSPGSLSQDILRKF